MSRKRSTLKAQQRHNVFREYRARGHSNNNLWLVYSPKTRRDWILPSDRQLVHWVHYLETCPEVKTFNLAPGPVLGHNGKQNQMTQLDAEVNYTDGRIEWHEVKAGEPDMRSSQLLAQGSAAKGAERIYRIFSDRDLAPHARTTIRWLKAISFAAALRDREYMAQRLALLAHLRNHPSGTAHSILSALAGHEAPVLLGLLAQLAIEGHVSLDLGRRGFGPGTPWRCLRSYRKDGPPNQSPR
jgi:hypothetical protein